MGMTTYRNAPHGRVLNSDVTVAKNYLGEAEYDKFNKQQRIESDFDQEVKKLLQKKDK